MACIEQHSSSRLEVGYKRYFDVQLLFIEIFLSLNEFIESSSFPNMFIMEIHYN